jgi:CBS domain-containing protein
MQPPRSAPTSQPATIDGLRRPPWSAIPVGQVMRAGVLTCTLRTPVREVARTMVTHGVHSVVVVDDTADTDRYVIGIVTDDGVIGAGLEGGEPVAGDVADVHAPMVSAAWTIEQAAREMVRSRVSHIVVIDGHGSPIGMLSTLDLARVMVWGHV